MPWHDSLLNKRFVSVVVKKYGRFKFQRVLRDWFGLSRDYLQVGRTCLGMTLWQ